MNDNPATTEVINYGRALVKALQAFEILAAKAGWFERTQLWLLRTTDRQRLRAIVELTPPEVGNRIFDGLGASSPNGQETG